VTTLAWIVAVALIVIGLAGVVLPALPGIALIFGGILLGAWIDDFTRISGWTIGVLGVLTAIAFVIDYGISVIAAKRAGASRLGLIGGAIGTAIGVFSGIVGLIFMPFLGAAIGEFLAGRDALGAGRVGFATWVGLVVGAVLKIGIAFAMVGVFIVALIL
jgi:uncharacterized protein YqgC (DUF456 family)